MVTVIPVDKLSNLLIATQSRDREVTRSGRLIGADRD